MLARGRRFFNAATAAVCLVAAGCAQSRGLVAPLPGGEPLRFVPARGRDAAAAASATEGRRRIVSAAWWGFDPADSTRALQSAIDSGAAVVQVPDMGSPWLVGPIRLRGGQEIDFEQGVVVAAKPGLFRGGGDSLFSADAVTNLTLRGWGASLRMRKSDYRAPPYERAEWRHALSLESCRNVLVEGLTIESSGGDGIYVGNARAGGIDPYCANVTIRGVRLLDHYRQGISVVSARGLLIEDCVIERTGGTAPQAGIDFEPNRPGESLEDCVVRRCRIERNSGAGIEVYLRNFDAGSAPVSITVESSVIRRNRIQVWVTPAGGSPRGTIRLLRNEIGWPTFVRGSEALAVEVER
jgi:hypothetical protein